MPNENSVVLSPNDGLRKKSKFMAIFTTAFVIGLILVLVFNSDKVPFGASLNRHPPQLIGLVIILAATFGLIILCVRCLVLSSSNQTPLASISNSNYTFSQQPSMAPTAWHIVYTTQIDARHVPVGAINGSSILNTGIHSYNPESHRMPYGQPNSQHGPANLGSHPQTPPPEFELPPSYAEATKNLPVIKSSTEGARSDS